LSLTADTDPVVAHVAVNALVTLRSAEVCLQALEASDSARLVPGALRVLRSLHEAAVVDGLIARLQTATDPQLRRGLLTALARLYQREADWDGKWWGTRPDTTGPYYKPVTWAESGKIANALRAVLTKADGETLKWLIGELQRNRVDLPEVMPALLKLAGEDKEFRRLAVKFLAERGAPPEQAIPLFGKVGASADEDPILRTKAVRALLRLSWNRAALEAAVSALTGQEKAHPALEQVWAEFVRDGKQVGNVAYFVKLTGDPSAARQELAYGVLAVVAGRNIGSREARAEAERIVEQAWAKPAAAVPLLHAVGRLNLAVYSPQVKRLLDDANPRVASAARSTAAALRIDKNKPLLPLIGKMKFNEVVALAAKAKGDAEQGAKLFTRQNCGNCHTVAATEPLKGPFLGGIATRYSRAELIESILQPSAKIAQGFETQVITLTSGKVLTGFVVRESGTELEVRDGTGAVTVLKKADIDERGPSKVSVMPEKLADELTTQELASLLAYLESLKGK